MLLLKNFLLDRSVCKLREERVKWVRCNCSFILCTWINKSWWIQYFSWHLWKWCPSAKWPTTKSIKGKCLEMFVCGTVKHITILALSKALELMWVRELLFWGKQVSRSTLRIFSRHIWWIEMTPGYDLTGATGSITCCHTHSDLTRTLEIRIAPACLLCTLDHIGQSAHLRLSSSPTPSYDWYDLHTWILMSLAMINLINNKYINLASRQGLILTSGEPQAPFNCCL